MLYPTPLPKISMLNNFFFKKDSTWVITNYEKPIWFCSGAEILLNICKQIDSEVTNIRIMIPSYFCGQSLKYLRSAGVKFTFYQLLDDLSPNYLEIEKKLKNSNCDLFLHVHYFGNISNQMKTQDLCKKYDLLMIEDCAHIIHPSVNDLWYGDYIFFSPYKFFPVPCSSVIFSKQKFHFSRLYKETNISFFWFFKKLLAKFINFNSYRHSPIWSITWSKDSSNPSFKLPNSFYLNIVNSDANQIKKISQTRQLNKNRLLKILLEYDFWKPIQALRVPDVPYILGMTCSSNFTAFNIQKKLRQVKCPIMMWPDMPAEMESSEYFQDDIERVKKTIFFFVHEQVDVKRYEELIKKALNER